MNGRVMVERIEPTVEGCKHRVSNEKPTKRAKKKDEKVSVSMIRLNRGASG
jgi:hypothetical protein